MKPSTKSVAEMPTMTAVLWDYPIPEGFHERSQAYKCTIRYRGRQVTTPFFVGPAWCKTPEIHDVLDCLFSDAWQAQETFESFCAEFGYDTDSRRAERIHKACKKTAQELKRLLRDDFDWVAEYTRRLAS